MKDGIERVKLAAVRINNGIIFTGLDHGEIIHTIVLVNKIDEKIFQEKQGFVTSKHRFVNRKEAGQIAFEAGQIDEPTDMLFSEDITGNYPWAKDEIKALRARVAELEREKE